MSGDVSRRGRGARGVFSDARGGAGRGRRAGAHRRRDRLPSSAAAAIVRRRPSRSKGRRFFRSPSLRACLGRAASGLVMERPPEGLHFCWLRSAPQMHCTFHAGGTAHGNFFNEFMVRPHLHRTHRINGSHANLAIHYFQILVTTSTMPCAELMKGSITWTTRLKDTFVPLEAQRQSTTRRKRGALDWIRCPAPWRPATSSWRRSRGATRPA